MHSTDTKFQRALKVCQFILLTLMYPYNLLAMLIQSYFGLKYSRFISIFTVVSTRIANHTIPFSWDWGTYSTAIQCQMGIVHSLFNAIALSFNASYLWHLTQQQFVVAMAINVILDISVFIFFQQVQLQ